MDLRSGYPFWLIKAGLPFSYPKLEHDVSTEVVVVGGGISGALVRYHLLEAGIDCVTVDARTVGLGSTCASTSLLQYEIDVPLVRLSDICGDENAQRAYHLCNDAIDKLGTIAMKIKFDDFTMRNSLYFAAYKKDVDFLDREFEARRKAGFNVEFLQADEIRKRYGFASPAAILSHHGAETDAYRFTHALLRYHDAPVFDRTKVVGANYKANGVELATEDGFRIKARKIVYATGYEVVEMLDKPIVKLFSTYAVVSEQYNEEPFWEDRALLWNTANPYLYLRTTPDGRIVIGGRDEFYYSPAKRDQLIRKKSHLLAADFSRLFPDIPFKPEFSWTGTFGSTKDGLPYIGTYRPLPNCYFALGFGGNGITFSQIAAEMIADSIRGKPHSDMALFSFNR